MSDAPDALQIIDERLAQLKKAHALGIGRHKALGEEIAKLNEQSKALEAQIIAIKGAADDLRLVRNRIAPPKEEAEQPEPPAPLRAVEADEPDSPVPE